MSVRQANLPLARLGRHVLITLIKADTPVARP